MKSVALRSISTAAVVAILLISHQLYAQNVQSGAGQIHYSVINLGTLGGSASNGYGGPNDRGWVTGDANLPGDQNEHAFLWRNGLMTDLGTLGGPNSSVSFPVKDEIGLIVGLEQTATVDPLGEFLGAAYICTTGSCQGFQNLQRGFVWQNGVMTALPTLGGNNNGALGVNNRGQIVGAAETVIRDPNCAPPQVLDFEAVIWGPQPNQIQTLPVFPGDSVAAAVGINNKGQVVGTSGMCAFPSFALGVHPVLWQHGTVTDLGSLGGVMFNEAVAINYAGQVVGQSDLPGDTTTHAFFWQNGVMTDLGTLPGDSYSTANDINEQGQVVGVSCNATFSVCRAFLWQNGVMTDLNTLISPDSPLYLTYGAGINDRREITGSACVLSNGVCTSEVPAFLAVPCDGALASFEACPDGAPGAPAATQAFGQRTSVILPESVRQHLQRGRGFGRFTVGPVKQQ